MSDQESQAEKFASLMAEAEINEHNWQEKVPELLNQIAEANQKAQTNWEQLLRKEAECQNIQRRATQEVENAAKFAIERLAGELLQVVDNFERALETPLATSDDKNLTGFVDGIKLTHKILLDTLGKFGITPINPLGEAFDPQFHEALSTQDSPDAEPDTVIAVYAKGYLLKGRLLRPARVVVCRAATAD
jgi:molecular chaperone GrpE